MKTGLYILRSLLLVLLFVSCTAVQADKPVRIGLLSFADKQETLRQWAPTAAYLQQAVAGYTFELVPLFYDELNEQVAAHGVDFVFTNPEHYVVLRNVYRISAMMTLVRNIKGFKVSTFGGVIFCRADNSAISRLKDVRGKRIAAVGRFSLGGFLGGIDTLKSEHINVLDGTSAELEFVGMPHSTVVQAVMAGRADVGIVRTGVLEDMAQAGALDLQKIRVLNQQPASQYPLLLSTQLYPEWPFAAMPALEPELTRAVAVTLMSLTPDAPAARAGAYSEFFPPADYTPVEELMRQFKVYPEVRPISIWVDLWEQYSLFIQSAALVLLLVVLAVAVYLFASNRNLRRLTALFQKAQEDLEIMAVAFNSQVGLIVTDRETRIVRANSAFCATLGYTEDQLVGSETAKLRGKSVSRGYMDSIWNTLLTQHHWQGEVLCRHAYGYDVPCIVTITAVRLDRVGLSGFVGSFVDISAQKTTEAEIRQLAYFDQLTDLPNRRYFLEKLQTWLSSRETGNALGALLFVDLDHFKLLNDSHGHSVGDELLRLIAGRLRNLTDANVLAARLGGDEFVVMLTELGTDHDAAQRTAQDYAYKIKDAILSPFRLHYPGGGEDASQRLRYSCSGSIGLALFGGVQEEISEVLKRADMAMYQAKQAGRNAIRIFDPSTQELLNQRTALVSDLNLALSETQFQLHYQIQVDANNTPLGAECLLRWNHPTLGQVSPALFIPLAEDCGAIAYIGHWVIREACKTLARWKYLPVLSTMTLSVNVSPKQLIEHDFVQKLAAAVAEFGVDARRLVLELTEGAVLQNVEDVIEKMARLRDLGVGLSIDDFGTGYSSLSYLQRLPISEIKVDKSFVHGMTQDEESYAIVGAIIALAEKLNFSVVAEGVETQSQRGRLLLLGVTALQGFLISRPTTLAALEAQVGDLASVEKVE